MHNVCLDSVLFSNQVLGQNGDGRFVKRRKETWNTRCGKGHGKSVCDGGGLRFARCLCCSLWKRVAHEAAEGVVRVSQRPQEQQLHGAAPDAGVTAHSCTNASCFRTKLIPWARHCTQTHRLPPPHTLERLLEHVVPELLPLLPLCFFPNKSFQKGHQ